MGNECKAPKLRFDGFGDVWEKRFLKDMTLYRNGKGHEDKQTANGRYELINLNSVSIDGGLKTSGRFINSADETLIENDLVMVLSDVGHGDLLGRVALIPENDKYVLNQRVALLRPNTSENPLFLFVYINAHQTYFKSKGAGMSQLNISKSNVEDFCSYMPTDKNEQAAIGNYFRFLDDTITLKKQQCDQTTNVKKAMLEKMFPKKGADVPEIRFEGFGGAWEKKPLGEIAEFNPKSTLPDVFRYVDLESVVGTSLVSYRVEHKKTAPSRAQRVARKGDIFFQTVRPYQKNNLLYDLPHTDVVFSTGYAQLRPKIDSYYLMGRLQEDSFVAEVLDYCTGTSYPAITSTNLALISVMYPIDQEEQTAIGNFFRNLDTLIEAQRQELEKLQNIKKACLSKMFV